MEPEAYLNTNAFETLFRSAYELAKKQGRIEKECLGNLFGEIITNKSKKRWNIEYTQPIQEVKRELGGVIVNSDVTLRRSEWALFNEHLGDYHSHYDGNDLTLSESDINDMRNDPRKIGLLIRLNREKQIYKIPKDKYTISGHVEKNNSIHRVDIVGYYLYYKVKRLKMKTSKEVLRNIS